jgi:hypothetical protein
LVEFYIKLCRPARLTIHPQGGNMDVVQGKTANFTVVPTNAQGQVVPDTNITVSTDDAAIATASVNTDGSSGVVTGVAPGTTNLNATDGTITATPVAVNVTQDLTVTTLTITPA